MKKKLLFKKILVYVALAVAAPVMLNAQGKTQEKTQGNAQANSGMSKKDKLVAKRDAIQARVSKAKIDKGSADSLIAASTALYKEGDREMYEVYIEQAKLEDRVFKVEMPFAEKMLNSKNKQEQREGMKRKAELRRSYNADIKVLKNRFSAAQKKKKESDQILKRGEDKMALADKLWEDAIAALKAVEKEIEDFEEAERAKEREAQQAQKRKEEEMAAKQKQREETELKKKKDREAMAAQREAERAKHLQEKEKLKSKEAEKQEKEKSPQQKRNEKDDADSGAKKQQSQQTPANSN
jgi:hypothetical protein